MGTASTAAAVAAADLPNLYIQLPDTRRGDQVAPIYVDAYEVRGRLLYRFDTVISNRGGTLDLYRDVTTGRTMQAVWPGGRPSTRPDPNREPTGDATIEDRTGEGASFEYVTSNSAGTDGHNHWHFHGAARYDLLAPGGARVEPKVGFCMYDSWGRAQYFPPKYEGVGPTTWCAPNTSRSSFVRMGLSPGGNDIYRSQVPFQWVDVTGLEPGEYTLRATANPQGAIEESNTGDNTLRVERTIPGTTARSLAVEVSAGVQESLRLSGTVVGASIPARKSSACQPSRSSLSCYLFADSDGPLEFRIDERPAHGTVTLGTRRGLEVEAVYRPAPGFSGTDSFTYTTSDARKLVSRPATVTLDVRPNPPANVVAPAITGEAEVGSTLSSSNGTWTGVQPLDYAVEWRRCTAGGAPCAPIEGATTANYVVSPADVGSRLKAVVTASNAGGSAASSSAPTGMVVVPTPVLERSGSFLGTSTTIRLSWLAEGDVLDWVASYDVRYHSIAPDGERTPIRSWLHATTKTGARLAGVPGRTYCFAARLRDTRGNVSDWTAGTCRALPLDDRSLERRTTWLSVSSPQAYRHTLSTATRRRSTLAREGVRTRTLALLVTRCPGCGVVEVLLSGQRLRRVSLASSVRKLRELVPIADFSELRSGTVSIRVASRRKPVAIDGLITSARRTG